ncbi:TIM barrel protein [Pontibacillus sp. ALD_SL1]|uniref:sugar phosphate isomerase/epimerase family protein n=1 Tax=Pontibacillus sp. ALD_SL1 TaxID=2777185 RepID=UPI001A971DD3|nr:TIM barrel protein [Pontibacillus sp. ALD_SL1]QST01737.1 TIM barrel protein [Pontibacillus sp. ALD_SL1]
MPKILLNTVLLEKNRWEDGQIPSIQVSKWVHAIKEEGFDGIELWQNHALKATDYERAELKHSDLSIDVFNSYIKFEDGYEQEREKIVNLVHELKCKAVKFNLGHSMEHINMYISHVKDMLNQLPDSCQLLCECHPGTIMEDPETAYQFLDQIGSNRVKAIIHPFHNQVNIEEWFQHLGSSITHAHVSLYNNKLFHLLSREESFVRKRITKLHEHQFTGSYSIEFTAGVASRDENTNEVFSNASEDHALLRQLTSELGV